MSKKEKKFEVGSEDYALEKVPDHARLSWFDISFIYTGFVIISTGLMVGVLVATHFPFWQGFWIMLAGTAIVVANATMMGYIGYRERTSYGLTTRFGFGDQGSRLPSGLLIITSQGWWIIQLLLLQSFWPNIELWKGAALLVFFGVLMTTTTRTGLQKGMKWLDRISIPALILLFIVSIYRALDVGGGWEKIVTALPSKPGELGVIAAVVMVAALWINGSTMYPDVARYAKSGGAVAAGALISFFIGLFGLGVMGLVFYHALKVTDFGPAFEKLDLKTFAFICIFVQLWTTNQSQIYSSSLAMSNAFRMKRTTSESILLVVSLIITVVLSAYPFQDIFIGFLILLGLFLTPVPGIMLAEYYVIHRMKVPSRLEDLPNLNKLAIFTYFTTVVLNLILWATVPKGAPIGLVTLNPLTSCIIHLIFNATLGKTEVFKRSPSVAE